MRKCQHEPPKPPVKPQNLTVTNIAKDSATLSWSGDKGDILLNDIVITEDIVSPYVIENLESNTEYTVKVVNKGGESNGVTFTTLQEGMAAMFDNGDLYDSGAVYA